MFATFYTKCNHGFRRWLHYQKIHQQLWGLHNKVPQLASSHVCCIFAHCFMWGVSWLIWVPFQVDVTDWVSTKHNMGMALNRSIWDKIKKCQQVRNLQHTWVQLGHLLMTYKHLPETKFFRAKKGLFANKYLMGLKRNGVHTGHGTRKSLDSWLTKSWLEKSWKKTRIPKSHGNIV